MERGGRQEVPPPAEELLTRDNCPERREQPLVGWPCPSGRAHIQVYKLELMELRLCGYLGWERPGRHGGIADQVRYSTVLKELAKTSKAGHYLLAFFF